MRNVLARAAHRVLSRFARSRVLLAFDYDGTLAPIVHRPEQATMRRSTQDLLIELTRLYPCVVISGRAQADVLRRLRNVPLHYVIGNHGIEPWSTSNKFFRRVQELKASLELALRGQDGVEIEDKAFSLAVHYRSARDKRAAIDMITKAAKALGPVRVIGGKHVVNILPKDAPHKGVALERAVQQLGCKTALFLGDDETDEDVFANSATHRLLAIRVGKSLTSAAPYYVPTQLEVDDLLRELMRLRLRAGIAEPPWGKQERAKHPKVPVSQS